MTHRPIKARDMGGIAPCASSDPFPIDQHEA